MYKIFYVEDEEEIRELVIYALKSSNFSAKGFHTGEELLNFMNREIPDLIILDIMLPKKDGLEILKVLKNNIKWRSVPIIFLTAKSAEFDRIKGLDLGADDYIVKPFSVMELISRINAVLRRLKVNKAKPVELKYEDITLNYNKRKVFKSNKEVELTYKEFELLYFLLKNKNIVLKREVLLEKIWGYDYIGETRTVDVHIGNIRRKIGNKDFIKTIRNVGYKIGDD